ncbi:transcriptional regulatory protein [Marmoricola endophyticus]|uniref:Transcriptional regulatory protein n=1 Tax=Marmoricola endophyticus TaxID=2040280 RepID=A0A917BSN6_9ACTN|nr:response regulator [Marmoricola endophyticus]GGF57479.1 transcriptional regulatory protein [Marmoricola endophyticus]
MTRRVLVVDDDFMVLRIHERFVAQTPGFDVVARARTGAEALAEAERTQPDVVLLDVHLPDTSGLEVLRALRDLAPRAVVVMVTAERDAEAVRAALRGGAQQYLVKPFAYDDLAARLAAVAGALDSLGEGETDQGAIDRAFGAAPTAPAPVAPAPPKGLSVESLALVRSALPADGDLSASEVAEEVGLSRVSARRYLEHLVTVGEADVRLRYGAGRPERRYSASP